MPNSRMAVMAAVILALASLTAASPKAFAHHISCGTELLEGSFGYSSQALAATTSIEIFNPIGNYSPFALAGAISFDGKGNLTGNDIVNLGSGGITRAYTGTYQVVDSTASIENCTFTATFTVTYGSAVPPLTPTTFNLYIVPALFGNFLELVDTDPGFIQAFKAERK